jgi:hypothetical protein
VPFEEVFLTGAARICGLVPLAAGAVLCGADGPPWGTFFAGRRTGVSRACIVSCISDYRFQISYSEGGGGFYSAAALSVGRGIPL